MKDLDDLTQAVALLAAALLVVWCATGCVGPRLSASPNGYVVARCNYAGVPMSGCWDSLLEACPDGFELLDRDQVGGMGLVTMTARCVATSSAGGTS